MLLYVRAQRCEIERLEGASRVHAVPMVCDEQLAVDEIHVGLDAVEAQLQRAEQWARVHVVVVRVGVLEWRGLTRGAVGKPEGGRE